MPARRNNPPSKGAKSEPEDPLVGRSLLLLVFAGLVADATPLELTDAEGAYEERRRRVAAIAEKRARTPRVAGAKTPEQVRSSWPLSEMPSSSLIP